MIDRDYNPDNIFNLILARIAEKEFSLCRRIIYALCVDNYPYRDLPCEADYYYFLIFRLRRVRRSNA
jgi:hypothetical protein